MKKIFLTSYLLLACFAFCAGQTVDANDADDREIRENPVIEENGEEEASSFAMPSYIKLNRNHVIMNGANWKQLHKAMANVNKHPVSIVHIGDSHLQADIATGVVRKNIQMEHGNAGRGLITPLKMSGTNQPLDYTFASTMSWNAAKLMKWPWNNTMGFTGTSISPTQRQSHLTLSTGKDEDYNPFSAVTLFHKGKLNVTRVENQDGIPLMFTASPSQDYTHIQLTEAVDNVKIFFDSAGDLTLFGASLSGNRPGIFYHTIGNNGATYGTYNRIGNVGKGIAPLNPDLVIISLGTNEAFGRRNVPEFISAMDRLVKSIQSANPNTQIMLVTPMECQKSVYSTVNKRVKRKKRKSRTVKQKVRSYAVNANILPIRNAIMQYGRDNNIAVYDWYEVAGGAGASSLWLKDKMFGSDRVHHTHKGYNIQGDLLYKALSEALNNN